MTESLAAGAPLVLDLLNYIEQVEKLKTKPAFTVPSEFFVAYQHELKGCLSSSSTCRSKVMTSGCACPACRKSFRRNSTSNSSLG
jgi:hypothetical protein